MLTQMLILWLSLHPYHQNTSYTSKTTNHNQVIQPTPKHVIGCMNNSKEPLIGGKNLQGKTICKF